MSAEKFALQSWEKSEVHLTQAAPLNPDSASLAVIHYSYYAMFHAARPALLRITGSAPKKHSSVIGQFGLNMKDRGEVFRAQRTI